MKKLITILFLLFSLIGFSQTTYYVSTSGSDSNDGLTISTPWQTLDYAEANATSPGDTIALKKGDIWVRDNVFEITHGGSSSNDIVWDGGLWGTGDNAVIQSASDGGLNPKFYTNFRIVACSYVTVENITIDGNNYNRYGLTIGGEDVWDGPTAQNNEHDITIQDCHITRFGGGSTVYEIGLLVRPEYTNIWNITIQRNLIDSINDHAIALYPTTRGDLPQGQEPMMDSSVYIGYNTIRSWGYINDSRPRNAIHIGNHSVYATVEHNDILDDLSRSNGAITLDQDPADPAYYPHDITIRYNRVEVNTDQCFATYAGQAQSADIYGNLFITNSTAGVAIYLFNGYDYTGAKFNIYNNTFIVRANERALMNGTDIAGVTTFKNNLIYNTNTNLCIHDHTANTLVHSNNVIYNTTGGINLVYNGTTYYTSANISSWEPTAVIDDPLFINVLNNWHLQSGSPAIGAGIAIAGITNDYDGVSYDDPPSIGAYEYVPKAYYVSTSGSDSNDGLTTSTPWKTISHVNAQTFEPGDSILFNKGDIWRETLTVPSSGISQPYIKFGAYGTGAKPQILGSEQAITWTLTGTANVWQSATSVTDPYAGGGDIFFLATDTIFGTHKDYVDLSELTQEYDWTWNAGTLYVYATTDPDVRYNSIEAAQRASGVDVNGNDHLEFDGIDLFFCLETGLKTTTNTLNHTGLIIRNIESAFHGYSNGSGYGVTACFNDLIIEKSKFHDLGRRGVSIVNYSDYDIDSITIQDNEFYNGYHTTGPDIETGGSGWSGNINNITVRRNKIYEDETRSGTNNTILLFAQGPHGGTGEIHNLHINTNIFRFMVGPMLQMEDVDTAFIYNNDFYDMGLNPVTSAYQIFITDGSTQIKVKNNIFYCSRSYDTNVFGAGLVVSASASANEVEADYNLYYRINNSLRIMSITGNGYYMNTSFPTPEGYETNGLKINPLFSSAPSDLTLQASSPAIGAGVNVGITTDYAGNTYNDPPSIGAYEYVPKAYYVSTSGSDANDGLTTSTPWQTLSYAESHAINPGDTIALKAGDTFNFLSGTPITINHGGTASNHIVWDGSLWGTVGDKAVIQNVTSDGATEMLEIADCSYLTFQNIIIDGGDLERWGVIIGDGTLSSTHHINFLNNEIRNVGVGISPSEYSLALLVRPWTSSTPVHDINISYNYIHDVANSGINLYPWRSGLAGGGSWTPIYDVTVSHNKIEKFALAKNPGNNTGISIHGWVYNSVIEYNVVTADTLGEGGCFNSSSSLDDPSYYPYNDTVRYNKFYSYELPAIASSSGDLAPMTFYYYGNLIYRTGTNASFPGAVRLEGGTTGASYKFHNNTITTDIAYGAFRCTPNVASMVELKNNILYTSDNGFPPVYFSYGASLGVHNNNLYYISGGGDQTLIYINDGTSITNSTLSSWESTADDGDPLFVTNYSDLHLQLASPAIGAGVDVGITTDYDGVSYGSPPAIGAYEYLLKVYFYSGKPLFYKGKIIW